MIRITASVRGKPPRLTIRVENEHEFCSRRVVVEGEGAPADRLARAIAGVLAEPYVDDLVAREMGRTQSEAMKTDRRDACLTGDGPGTADRCA